MTFPARPPTDAELLARYAAIAGPPRASALLGIGLLALDHEERRVDVAFDARDAFTNPLGHIQGGFLSAMLEEAMLMAGLLASGLTHITPALETKTSFHRPAFPGRLHAMGRVMKWSKSLAFLEGELFDPEGRLIVEATSTATPVLLRTRLTAPSDT